LKWLFHGCIWENPLQLDQGNVDLESFVVIMKGQFQQAPWSQRSAPDPTDGSDVLIATKALIIISVASQLYPIMSTFAHQGIGRTFLA